MNTHHTGKTWTRHLIIFSLARSIHSLQPVADINKVPSQAGLCLLVQITRVNSCGYLRKEKLLQSRKMMQMTGWSGLMEPEDDNIMF